MWRKMKDRPFMQTDFPNHIPQNSNPSNPNPDPETLQQVWRKIVDWSFPAECLPRQSNPFFLFFLVEEDIGLVVSC